MEGIANTCARACHACVLCTSMCVLGGWGVGGQHNDPLEDRHDGASALGQGDAPVAVPVQHLRSRRSSRRLDPSTQQWRYQLRPGAAVDTAGYSVTQQSNPAPVRRPGRRAPSRQCSTAQHCIPQTSEGGPGHTSRQCTPEAPSPPLLPPHTHPPTKETIPTHTKKAPCASFSGRKASRSSTMRKGLQPGGRGRFGWVQLQR